MFVIFQNINEFEKFSQWMEQEMSFYVYLKHILSAMLADLCWYSLPVICKLHVISASSCPCRPWTSQSAINVL